MKHRFYRDQAGDPRAEIRGAERLLGDFLESEVQDAAVVGRELLQRAAAVAAGREPAWEQSGNAHTIRCQPDGIILSADFSDDTPPLRLGHDRFQDMLRRWLEFLARE